ncbi:MAG: hypothetical protein ACI4V2_05970 [Alloprevotella sp.]
MTNPRNTAAKLRETIGGQGQSPESALATKMPITSGSVMMVSGGVGR